MSQMTNIRIILTLICCVVYATASPPHIPDDASKETDSVSSLQGEADRVDSSSVELYVDETLLGSGGASDTSDEEYFDHNVHENMNGRPKLTPTSIANKSRSSNSKRRFVAQQANQKEMIFDTGKKLNKRQLYQDWLGSMSKSKNYDEYLKSIAESYEPRYSDSFRSTYNYYPSHTRRTRQPPQLGIYYMSHPNDGAITGSTSSSSTFQHLFDTGTSYNQQNYYEFLLRTIIQQYLKEETRTAI